MATIDKMAYLPTQWHLDPFSRLAATDMGRKLRAVPFGGSGAVSLSNTMWPGPRPTSMQSFILIHPAVWPQQTCTENWGLLCPIFFWGEDGSPSNTMWPGPTLYLQAKFHLDLSNPFGLNTPTLQTYGTDRQDNKTAR